MEEDQPTGFKIGLDEPEPESAREPESKKTPPKKGPKSPRESKSTTILILFLGFLVLGGTVAWIYYDLQDRLRMINTSGSEELNQLSREVSTKFSDINNQLTVLSQSMQKALADIKTDISDTNNRIDKLQASIATFEKNLGSLKQTIDPLKERVRNLGADLGEMSETAKNFKDNQSDIQSRLQAHSKEIEKLSETMVDKAMLDNALKKEREYNKENMAHATEALFSEVASFQDQLKTMHDNLNQLDERILELRQSINEKNLQPPEAPPGSDAQSLELVPENGEIVEQEIE